MIQSSSITYANHYWQDACKSEWEAHETMIQRQKQAMEESKKVAFIRDSEYPIV